MTPVPAALLTRRVTTVVLIGLLSGQGAGAQVTNDHPGDSTPASLDPVPRSLFYQADDGEFQAELNGRLQLDAGVYRDIRNQRTYGAQLRRGRLGVTARLRRTWGMELEIEHSDDNFHVQDAWISYDGHPSALLKVGHFKEPFSLERMASSIDMTFLERALPNALTPGRNLGIGYSHWGNNWRLTAGIFGALEREPRSHEHERTADDGFATTTRFTVSPLKRTGRTVHLGVSASYRPSASDQPPPHVLRLRARPETRITRAWFLDTGRLPDINHISLWGTEAAVVMGPALIQGEYIRATVQRLPASPTSSASFAGAYVHTAWILTGEKRRYSHASREDSEFQRIIPSHQKGTWEIAARYSWLDLNARKTSVTGGHTRNLTFGLTWYANLHMRLLVNYVIVDDAVVNRAPKEHAPNIFQVRVQAHF